MDLKLSTSSFSHLIWLSSLFAFILLLHHILSLSRRLNEWLIYYRTRLINYDRYANDMYVYFGYL